MEFDLKKIEKVFGIIGMIASIYGAMVVSPYFAAVVPIGIIIYFILNKLISIKRKVKGLIKVKTFSSKITAQPNYIFVYGSLLNPESLLRTIERRSNKIEYIPCSLKGYSLEWINVGLRINMIDNDWNSSESNNYGALNLLNTNEINDMVNGAIFQVTNEELRKLKHRERNYNLKNISSDVVFKNKVIGISNIRAFISDKKDTKHFVIRNEYLLAVKSSLKHLGFSPNEVSIERHKVVKTFNPSIKFKNLFSNKTELLDLTEQLNEYLQDNKCVRYFDEDELNIPSITLPLIINRSTFSEIIKISETAIMLSKKTFSLIEKNDSLKVLSGYSDTCFNLAKEHVINTRPLPEITRVDICLTKDSIKIFEVNTDSPGGMFHLDCLLKKQKEFLNDKKLLDKIDINLSVTNNKRDICKSVVDCLITSWQNFSDRKGINYPLKTIAILEKDWRLWSTRTEFEYFKELLNGEGYDTELYEPDELEYKNEALIVKASQKKIDLIYKRVLWNSFFDSKDQSNKDIENNPVFRAYRDDSVCMVNSMNSWLLGNKLALAIQKSDSFEKELADIGLELTEYEKKVLKENIPETYVWGDNHVDKKIILNRLDSYILKSFTGFGSKEFVTGRNNAIVRDEFIKLFNEKYIVQEKLNHGRSIIPNPENIWENWNYIIGAYVVNGHCIGLEAKFAEKAPITMNYDNHGKPVGFRTAVFPTKN